MKNQITLSILLIGLFATSCGHGTKINHLVTISTAWNHFSAKEYDAALNQFEELIPIQGSPAIVGAGWSSIRLGQLSEAETFFAQASSSDPDGLTGWALVLWSKSDLEGAISKANEALLINAQYVFSRDNRVDFRDLIWIQAASYFQLHDFTSCISKLQLLDPNFAVDPNSPNIDQLLLDKLQSLGSAHE